MKGLGMSVEQKRIVENSVRSAALGNRAHYCMTETWGEKWPKRRGKQEEKKHNGYDEETRPSAPLRESAPMTGRRAITLSAQVPTKGVGPHFVRY
jgi:hypothetical protein